MKKETVIRSFLFKAAESFGNQGIAFVVNIVLARLIDPSDYGVLTLLAVFIAISRVFVSSGLNTALIQKPQIDRADYDAAFCFSMSLSLLMYSLLWIFAPHIAAYYRNESLSPVLRVLALVLLPGAYSTVQQAMVARERRFGELMRSSLAATLLSGILGIFLAYRGCAYWALVAQQLAGQIIQAVLLALQLRWLPRLRLQWQRLRALLFFGWKLLLSGIADVVYENLRALVIGKQYTEADLGYYNRGRQFPELIMSGINSAVQSVMLPVLAEHQDSQQQFTEYMRKSVLLSSYIVFPMMMGLGLAARPLISLLLTDKWLACVPFLQLACADFALYPLHTANLQALNAMGRSDLFLKLEIIKKTYGLAILFVSIFCFHSVFAIVAGASLSSLISFFVNALPNRRLMGYGIAAQLRDLLPNLALSLGMGLCVAAVSLLGLSDALTLLLQILVGLGSFLLLSHWCRLESFLLLQGIVKRLFKKES